MAIVCETCGRAKATAKTPATEYIGAHSRVVLPGREIRRLICTEARWGIIPPREGRLGSWWVRAEFEGSGKPPRWLEEAERQRWAAEREVFFGDEQP